MKTTLWTLAALVALGLNGCGGAGAGSTDYHPYDAPSISDAQKKEFLDAVNTARATGRSCGSMGWFDAAPALEWSDGLYKAAAEHSQDMLAAKHYEHSGSGEESDWTAQVLELGRGSTWLERGMNNAGDMFSDQIGENIHHASRDLNATMEDWLNSPGHCSNIMDPDFTHLGMSVTENSDREGWYYWTQEFGVKKQNN